MTYCIDTSSLMDGWVRFYPPELFPSLWEHLAGLVSTGTLVSSEEVLREIAAKEDALHEWVRTRREMFLPLDDDVQAAVARIMSAFPRLVDSRSGKSFADPFVIATAQVTERIVVTAERATGKSQRPKIPDVCDHFNIKHIALVDLIRLEGWTF